MEKEEKAAPKKTTRSTRKKATPKPKKPEAEATNDVKTDAKATKTTARKKAVPSTAKKTTRRASTAKKTTATKPKTAQKAPAKKAAPKTTVQKEVQPPVPEAVNEAPVTEAPEVPAEGMTAPEHGPELMASGIKFFGQLAQTLRSEDSTEQLVQSITEQDEKTGQTYLKIPVENKQTVEDAITMLSTLFKALQ